MTNNVEIHAKMPVLFVGHGSPMNAIEENSFVQGWRAIANSFQKPDAILCISAHWETKGTCVTAMDKPKTIHDFGGFPETLYQVQYPAHGSSSLAHAVEGSIKSVKVEFDFTWGLDHGCWSVIKHMYPNANIPVVQISLDYTQQPIYHFDFYRINKIDEVFDFGYEEYFYETEGLCFIEWPELIDEILPVEGVCKISILANSDGSRVVTRIE